MSISVATLLDEVVASQRAHRLGKSADVERMIAVADVRESSRLTHQVRTNLEPDYNVQVLHLGSRIEVTGYSNGEPPKSPTSGYFRLVFRVIPVEGP